MIKFFATSAVILFIGMGLLLTLPIIIRNEINRKMNLSNDTTLFNSWTSCRSGIIVEFYFFVVSNTKDFMAGKKPILKQIGPYTYEQTTCKGILQSSPNNATVRYADRNSFRFISSRSVGLESDIITVLNIGYVAIARFVSSNKIAAKMVDFFINLFYHHQLFLRKTVYETIWGYEDPVLKAVSRIINVQHKIGLYVDKNNTLGALFEINDGVRDTADVGKILTFNGFREMSVWKTPLANSINGSDGSLFPPFLGSASTVHVFSADLCRSLEFDTRGHDKPVYINHVPTTKYSLSNKTFLSPDKFPDNRGFCLDYPNCPKSGVLDMQNCMKGAPLAISLPHFNGADQSYRDAVIGMHPRSGMDISIFIEPQTGAVLQALQLIQVNAIVSRDLNFPELATLPPTTYLPIGYINTSICVSESVAHTLMSALILPQMSISMAASLMITGSLVSILVVSGMMFANRRTSPLMLCGSGTEENTPLIVECPADSIVVPEQNVVPITVKLASSNEDTTSQIAQSEPKNEESEHA